MENRRALGTNFDSIREEDILYTKTPMYDMGGVGDFKVMKENVVFGTNTILRKGQKNISDKYDKASMYIESCKHDGYLSVGTGAYRYARMLELLRELVYPCLTEDNYQDIIDSLNNAMDVITCGIKPTPVKFSIPIMGYLITHADFRDTVMLEDRQGQCISFSDLQNQSAPKLVSISERLIVELISYKGSGKTAFFCSVYDFIDKVSKILFSESSPNDRKYQIDSLAEYLMTMIFDKGICGVKFTPELRNSVLKKITEIVDELRASHVPAWVIKKHLDTGFKDLFTEEEYVVFSYFVILTSLVNNVRIAVDCKENEYVFLGNDMMYLMQDIRNIEKKFNKVFLRMPASEYSVNEMSYYQATNMPADKYSINELYYFLAGVDGYRHPSSYNNNEFGVSVYDALSFNKINQPKKISKGYKLARPGVLLVEDAEVTMKIIDNYCRGFMKLRNDMSTMIYLYYSRLRRYNLRGYDVSDELISIRNNASIGEIFTKVTSDNILLEAFNGYLYKETKLDEAGEQAKNRLIVERLKPEGSSSSSCEILSYLRDIFSKIKLTQVVSVIDELYGDLN